MRALYLQKYMKQILLCVCPRVCKSVWRKNCTKRYTCPRQLIERKNYATIVRSTCRIKYFKWCRVSEVSGYWPDRYIEIKAVSANANSQSVDKVELILLLALKSIFFQLIVYSNIIRSRWRKWINRSMNRAALSYSFHELEYFSTQVIEL